jgi:regulation of enolase protein 1 (concanavalin A-like superfamily)
MSTQLSPFVLSPRSRPYRVSLRWIVARGAALLLVLARPASAGPPPAPWVPQDVGAPTLPGSTDVTDGVWTVKGSGRDIFDTADQFHFVYQRVKGDVTLTARFLSREGGHPRWSMTGLMIRANDTAGSPNLNYTVTPTQGLHINYRLTQDVDSRSLHEVGPATKPEANLVLHLQRVDNEIACFYSRDSSLWYPVDGPPVTLPTLGEEALVGLAASSLDTARVVTGRFDQVRLTPGGFAVGGLQACGADRAVLLRWRPLKNALGYNVYRGGADAARADLVRLTTDAVPGTTYADMSPDLTNGSPMRYAVAALLPGSDNQPVEGPLVSIQGTPVAVPPGYFGCSMNAGPVQGSVLYDAATGLITLQGSGLMPDSPNISIYADQGYFLLRPVEGDFQVTVKMLNRLTPPRLSAPAGLVVRESLDPGARYVSLVQRLADGFVREQRRSPSDPTTRTQLIRAKELTFPILLRITRQGNTLTAAYSRDDGKTFEVAGPPLEHDPPLDKTLYVGVAACSGVRGALGSVQFSGLDIKQP